MAILDALVRIARSSRSTMAVTVLYTLAVQGAAGAALEVASVGFETPSESFSRYHLAVDIANKAGETVTVTSVGVGGEAHENFAVFVGGKLSKDDSIPAGEEARIRLSYPWQNSTRYSVEVSARGGEGEKTLTTRRVAATAPSRGGYWDAAWRHYKVLNLVEEAGLDRGNEPVQVTVNFPAARLRDPYKELRLVTIGKSGVCDEVPLQILWTSSVDVEGEEYPDTVACRLLFYASVPSNSTRPYIVFFDNPEASPEPPSSSELEVEGEGLGLTIENPYYRVTLAEQSGQINGILIKQGLEKQLSHGGNAIHWNPGCYAPPRPWGHTYGWNPPEGTREIRGPLAYVLQRWGRLPQLPEVWVSVTYSFYARTPYFVMSSTIAIRDDIAVLALRNDEMVFEPELFTDLGWRDKQGAIRTMPLGQNPGLAAGYTQVLPADTPWLCFFAPGGGYGYGSLRLAYSSASTTDAEAIRYNDGTYVTAPSSALVYWYRALVYHFFPGPANPVHLFTKVNRGAVYHETNAYLPFALAEGAGHPLDPINRAYEGLAHPLRVSFVDWGRDDLAAVGQRGKD